MEKTNLDRFYKIIDEIPTEYKGVPIISEYYKKYMKDILRIRDVYLKREQLH